jgi:hypothetical protein
MVFVHLLPVTSTCPAYPTLLVLNITLFGEEVAATMNSTNSVDFSPQASDRRLSAKLVPTLWVGGCRVVSAVESYGP